MRDNMASLIHVAFQYLKCIYRIPGEGFFVREYSDRTKSNGCELKEGRLHIRKKFFTEKVVRYWNTLRRREVLNAPSLSVQGQVRWSFEQADLVGDIPAHGKGNWN